MDPMSQMISGLPAPAANPGDANSFMQPQQQMFGGQPQQPQAPQNPIPPMQTMPAMPAAPTWQQPVPQPPAPGAAPQQYPQAQPGAPMVPGMPMAPAAPMIPQFPSQQQQQMPAWAQQLAESVQQLQGGQQSGGGAGGAAFDPTKPWSADNRPKSWDEMRQANEALATQKAQEIVTQTLEQQQQAQQQQLQAEQAANAAIDSTFNRLRLSGALPQITNPNDPNDPGKLAERELLGYTMAMGGQSAEDMVYAAPALLQRHQMGEYYDVREQKMARRGSQSVAAFAPMAGGAPMMGQMGQPAGPTQSQLASGARDLGSLMQLGMDQIQ